MITLSNSGKIIFLLSSMMVTMAFTNGVKWVGGVRYCHVRTANGTGVWATCANSLTTCNLETGTCSIEGYSIQGSVGSNAATALKQKSGKIKTLPKNGKK